MSNDSPPRRPSPLGRLLRFLFTTPTGRYALGALVLLGLAVAARQWWVEQHRPAAEVQRQDIGQRLDVAIEALRGWSDGRASGSPALPESTSWTPAVLECGREAPAVIEGAHPTWGVLQWSFAAPSRYQVRFTATPELTWELLARTDSDCDGLYEVFRRSGGIGIAGLTVSPTRVDNPGE